MRKKEDIETIYRAALAVFGDFGYAKTTMEEIAGRLNMTKGNLYLYAKNKKGLYREAVSWALRNWQNRVRAAIEDEPDARARFRVMCAKAVEYLSSDRDFRNVLVHDPDIFPLFPDRDPFEEINAGSVSMIQSVLEQGIREGSFLPVNAGKTALVIFMIYKMFIIRWYIHGNGEAMEQIFPETVNLMTHGLFSRGPDTP